MIPNYTRIDFLESVLDEILMSVLTGHIERI